jgi:hypothetical protein
MTAAAPSGVVTFLFTDVEGSTRRWEAEGVWHLVARRYLDIHAQESQSKQKLTTRFR